MNMEIISHAPVDEKEGTHSSRGRDRKDQAGHAAPANLLDEWFIQKEDL